MSRISRVFFTRWWYFIPTSYKFWAARWAQISLKQLACINQVLQSDLVWSHKWPFQGLSDLHLGKQKVTLKKLEYIELCKTFCTSNISHHIWTLVPRLGPFHVPYLHRRKSPFWASKNTKSSYLKWKSKNLYIIYLFSRCINIYTRYIYIYSWVYCVVYWHIKYT